MVKDVAVILVHGIWDDGKVFDKISQALEQNGYINYQINLIPSDGTVGADLLAEQLDQFINSKIGEKAPFHLIGFSLGGMVSRYYLQNLGGLVRVQKFITISSPHFGTLFAYLLNNQVGKQLRPGSKFLQELNKNFRQISRFSYSLATPFDLMIVPTTSSIIPGRHTWVYTPIHPLMLTNKKSISKIIEILKN